MVGDDRTNRNVSVIGRVIKCDSLRKMTAAATSVWMFYHLEDLLKSALQEKRAQKMKSGTSSLNGTQRSRLRPFIKSQTHPSSGTFSHYVLSTFNPFVEINFRSFLHNPKGIYYHFMNTSALEVTFVLMCRFHSLFMTSQ